MRVSNKKLELKGDLLIKITNNDLNLEPFNPQDQKILFDFGNALNFVIKQVYKKSTRNKIMQSCLNHLLLWLLGLQKQDAHLPILNIFVIDKKVWPHKKEVVNKSNIINEQIAAIVDEVLNTNAYLRNNLYMFLNLAS